MRASPQVKIMIREYMCMSFNGFINLQCHGSINALELPRCFINNQTGMNDLILSSYLAFFVV